MSSAITWIWKDDGNVKALRVALWCGVALGCLGCGGEAAAPEECVHTVPPAGCTPLYSPTFQHVYQNTLIPGCAGGGGACHALQAARGGLGFGDEYATHQALLSPLVGQPTVIPGDPSCSLLNVRMETSNTALLMPPGFKLSTAERCAVAEWVRAGAPP